MINNSDAHLDANPEERQWVVQESCADLRGVPHRPGILGHHDALQPSPANIGILRLHQLGPPSRDRGKQVSRAELSLEVTTFRKPSD
jgi:hypothetical protein